MLPRVSPFKFFPPQVHIETVMRHWPRKARTTKYKIHTEAYYFWVFGHERFFCPRHTITEFRVKSHLPLINCTVFNSADVVLSFSTPTQAQNASFVMTPKKAL